MRLPSKKGIKRKKPQRIAMMLKRAGATASNPRNVGGIEKVGRHRPKPVTLAKIGEGLK
jgi:hypothetical protein